MSKIDLVLRPKLPRTKGALVWLLLQGDANGSEGTRPEMVRLLKATILARVEEGFTVDAKVYTAANQLEEWGTYATGHSHAHAVPKPEGEGGFGRKCRTLNESDEQKKKRQEATRAPKVERPPKPKPKKFPKEPKPKAVKPPKEPKVKPPKEPKVKPPKEPKARTPKAAAKPSGGGTRAAVMDPSAGEAGFDAFLDQIMKG